MVKKESIGEIKRVDNDDEERDKFVKEHKVIFDCMGTFPTKYNIKTVNNAGGVINPPRRVPLTILERLKIELLNLDKNKIIEKVEEPKEWSSNLVIEQKTDKSLRLFLDPKELNTIFKRDYL